MEEGNEIQRVGEANQLLKTHASRLIRELSDNQGTLIVTHNGQAKAVVSGHSYFRANAGGAGIAEDSDTEQATNPTGSSEIS